MMLLSAEYPPQPGGVGDYTRRLALALAAAGHDLSVLTGRGNGTAPPAERLQQWASIGGWDWRCWRETIAALDQARPHVLHLQYQTGAYGMHPAINLLPWRLRVLPRRPAVVVTFHDLLEPYLFPKAGPARRWITNRLARDADAVVVTNAADAATLRARRLAPTTIPIGSNIPVMPPAGFWRPAWRAALGLAPNETLVAYFGLLARAKGVDVLLDALDHLPDQSPPLRLLLIGGSATAPQDRAYAATLQARLQQPSLRERIIQTGHVDEATVSAHLLASDLVVLPFHDGASFRSGSLLAALSHGAAVLTTQPAAPAAPGELPRLVNETHALLVPPGEPAALAAALQRLATDARLRERLSSGARTLAAHFGWDAIAQRHVQLYATLPRPL
jgi:glycosyltransferase involved in cell wall biosynthesis